MSTNTKYLDQLNDDERAIANVAFTAVSDVLKANNIPVTFDDRAERVVEAVARFMIESKQPSTP